MFSFIHAADIHLDSPLRGLARYEGAPVEAIRNASRRALEKLVALAIQEEVAFVILAGDIYDGDWRDHNTGMFFARQMSRLRQANIPVYMVKGNHDAASRITKELRLPDNVHEFSSKAPATMRIENLGVALHGQSFATASVMDDLGGGYPAAIPDFYNIAILHTSADGREGHDSYAPTTVVRLLAKGYDYWGLGHVHAREELNADPPIHFSGVIQGRHIGEAGAKGCLLVRVDDRGRSVAEFRALDVVRWMRCEVDGRDCNRDELYSRFQSRLSEALDQADDRLCAIRIVIQGEHAPAMHDLREIANDFGRDRVWIEKVLTIDDRDAGRNIQLPEGAMHELSAVLHRWETDESALESVVTELRPLAQKLAELRGVEIGIEITDPQSIRRSVAGARDELLRRLLGPGAAQ